MTRDIKERYATDNVMVVSPDVGGVVRARALAKRIEAPLSIVDKRRDKPGESEVMNIIGDVKGYDCILVDDIVDSGGTLCNAAEALLSKGAQSVTAYITHGVLSGGAVARVTSSKLKELVITNSIEPTAPSRLQQHPCNLDCPADRRSNQPHGTGKVRFQPLQLIAETSTAQDARPVPGVFFFFFCVSPHFLRDLPFPRLPHCSLP